MNTTLVITLLTDDRPGLIGELSATVSAHGGNWLESSFAQLAGKFAGILKLNVPGENQTALEHALRSKSDFRLTIETAVSDSEAQAVQATRRLNLSLIGHDRIGIVREVTQVLARHAVNIERLDSSVSSAAMSAEPMFKAEAELLVPAALDTALLQSDLERLSADLMVDIELQTAA